MKPTILFVEDDSNLRAAIGCYLSHHGYTVIGKATGAEALQYNSCTLVGLLLDIHLPDMCGLTLSHIFREKYGPQMPIVLLSGDSSMEVIKKLVDAGATYYFRKPVNPALLLERLRPQQAHTN